MKSENYMTLQKHLEELRVRLIFCVMFFFVVFCLCYFFSAEIYNFLLQPFLESSLDHENRRLIYTSPTEAFTTYLKLSFYSSFTFCFPIFASQFYFFLAPGLYKNEKKNLLIILFSSSFLFLFGALIAYYFILPIAIEFFSSFEIQGSAASLPIQLEARISEYLNLVSDLIFGFGVAFQLPILLLFLIRVGLLSINDLKKKRRYFIVAIFIIAAVLTPPDVLSQTSLAIPMIILFEIVILVGKNFNNKK
ncbi:MAG: twin-arginine translocase subunit TatC [Proteobacteria bacterium]|nr:twin-arginine translocase subunit TatC [Pseudomonadota bacterium]